MKALFSFFFSSSMRRAPVIFVRTCGLYAGRALPMGVATRCVRVLLVVVAISALASCKRDPATQVEPKAGSLKVRVSTAELGFMDQVEVSLGSLARPDTLWLPPVMTDAQGTAHFAALEPGDYAVKLPGDYMPLFAPHIKTVKVHGDRESEITIQVNYTGQGHLPHDSTFVIQTEYPAELIRERLAQNMRASDFEPVGFYLPPGQSMTIHVDQIRGSDLPVLLVGTYSRQEWHDTPAEYALSLGENHITDPDGGLLYLRYNGIPGVSSCEVRFAEGMKRAPFYRLGTTTHEEWKKMLAFYSDVPDVQLYGDKVIIVVSRENAMKHQDEDPKEALIMANSILDFEADISGLDNSSPLHARNPHNFLMTETTSPAIYMAATHYRTMYHSSVADVLLTAEGINSWGVWHELGHQHQQYAWTWSNLTEVTVNIYSLATQRAMGFTPSRLVEYNNWSSVAAYLQQPAEARDFLSIGGDEGNWVKLGMFDQLRLAFGDSFYKTLHKITREERPSTPDDEAKMRYFMINACKISGRDLSDFFRKWGFRVNESVYTAIGALNLPVPDSDLTEIAE